MKRAVGKRAGLSRGVQRKILERCARGEQRMVLVARNGKPSSVWGYEEYKEREALPKKVKPWEKRGIHASAPDPLGAIDAEPPQPLTREGMYEE